ncbi:MAG: retropepsin-like aspartic protease [Methylococcaceae bacterium]
MLTKTTILKSCIGLCLSMVSLTSFADEIALIDSNGVYMLPITLNDSIVVEGILDTGASEMFIPFNVIASLIQIGGIATKDILKDGSYTLADGTIKNRERVNIAKIMIGNLTFTNVSAIVGANNSTVLIGQNVLKNINYTIDNKKKVLITTSSEKKLSPN